MDVWEIIKENGLSEGVFDEMAAVGMHFDTEEMARLYVGHVRHLVDTGLSDRLAVALASALFSDPVGYSTSLLGHAKFLGRAHADVIASQIKAMPESAGQEDLLKAQALVLRTSFAGYFKESTAVTESCARQRLISRSLDRLGQKPPMIDQLSRICRMISALQPQAKDGMGVDAVVEIGGYRMDAAGLTQRAGSGDEARALRLSKTLIPSRLDTLQARERWASFFILVKHCSYSPLDALSHTVEFLPDRLTGKQMYERRKAFWRLHKARIAMPDDAMAFVASQLHPALNETNTATYSKEIRHLFEREMTRESAAGKRKEPSPAT